MSFKKYGVTVCCEDCVCGSNDGDGNFDVTVPVSDSESRIAGTATLHCAVSREHHQVELREWKDADHLSISPTETVQRRISAALAFVADQRICGNRHICPAEVIQIVKKQNSC